MNTIVLKKLFSLLALWPFYSPCKSGKELYTTPKRKMKKRSLHDNHDNLASRIIGG